MDIDPTIRRAVAVALALCTVGASRYAEAGGLFFSDRGVRPMGRGGAFVAGADDLNAIYYNPAGLTDAGNQLMLDASLMFYQSAYTRQARVRQYDPNTGQPTGQEWDQTFPKAKGTSSVQPIPTLAVSNNFGLKNAMFALGLWTPYAAGTRYDQTVAGAPAPGRYMLLNLDGSALVVPGLWGAWAPAKWVSVGLGVQALVGTYRTLTAMTTCLPDRFLCAPEQPDYDAVTQMEVGPIFAPGGNAGVTFKISDFVRIGGSFQLPFHVDSDATVRVRLPSAAVFDRAYQDGNKANVKMDFPWIARAGVEVRWPKARTRAEIAGVYEAWHMHDTIHVTPKGVTLRDVELFPPEYRVGSIDVPRGFRDTYSVRLGAEHWETIGSYQIDARIGLMYERGAVPPAYLSTLTIDLDKYVLGLGASLHVSKIWRFDLMYAHVFGVSQTVSTDKARIVPVNPVRSTPADHPDVINAGKYEASADIVGLGIAVNYM
jgi:long-chain fatty acid transport protein